MLIRSNFLQNMPDQEVTKENYVQTVVDAIADFNARSTATTSGLRHEGLQVRLLLSINRREDSQAALETV